MVAYVVFVNEGTHTPSEMQIYGSLVPSTIQGYPLTILAKDGAVEALEGSSPEAVVLVSFPTMADARSWYHSPAYQDVAKHRLAGANFKVFLTEGLA